MSTSLCKFDTNLAERTTRGEVVHCLSWTLNNCSLSVERLSEAASDGLADGLHAW
jgi:hypothetical protein